MFSLDRRSHHKHAASSPPAGLLCDRVALGLLVALITFMPLAFGAVAPWSELLIMAACVGLTICLVLRACTKSADGGLIWSSAYLPLAGFIILALAQIIQLPMAALWLLSPRTAAIYQNIREDGPFPGFLSLYPSATWHDLGLILATGMVFLTVINVLRRTAQIKQLLLTVALIGAALALLALAQTFLGNGRIYWIGPAEVQSGSGTFACHNHFSQHMSLSIMAMLAYAMISIRQTHGGRWHWNSFRTGAVANHKLRAARGMTILAVVAVIAVAMSRSRMGFVSLLAGLTVLTLMLRRRKNRWWSALSALVGIVAVLLVALVDVQRVFDRLATLKDLDVYQPRWTVVSDLVPALKHFALTGSGLGTFSVVYPHYDTGNVVQFATHAENEYVQLPLEMGLPGLLLAAWFLTIVAIAAVRAIRRSGDPILVAAPPLAAGLIAVAIHSWTDFGQHLPAIAMLSATFCGLLVVLSRRTRTLAESSTNPLRKRQTPSAAPAVALLPPPTSWPAFTVVAFLGVLLVLSLPAAWGRLRADRRDIAATGIASQLAKASWQGSDGDYARLLDLSQAAVHFAPGNALYRYRLGVYRWRAAARGVVPIQPATAPSPEIRATAEQVVQDMIAASASCPAMGIVQCWRGQMEWWVLGRAQGQKHLEWATQMARNDPTAWSAAAQVSVVQGQHDLAFTRLQRAAELRPGLFPQAAQTLADSCARPDLALALAGDDPARLHQASEILAKCGFAPESAAARDRAAAIYRGRVDEPDTPAWAVVMLAQDSSRQGHNDEAAALYRKALTRDSRMAWQLSCARELLLAGHTDEAQRQLQSCERLSADPAEIAKLKQTFSAARRAVKARSRHLDVDW